MLEFQILVSCGSLSQRKRKSKFPRFSFLFSLVCESRLRGKKVLDGTLSTYKAALERVLSLTQYSNHQPHKFCQFATLELQYAVHHRS